MKRLRTLVLFIVWGMQINAVLQITSDRCNIVGNKEFSDLEVLKSFSARFDTKDFYLKFLFNQVAEDQHKFSLGSIKVCRADAKSTAVDTVTMIAKDFLVNLELNKTLIPDSNGVCRLAAGVTLYSHGKGLPLSLIIARDMQLNE